MTDPKKSLEQREMAEPRAAPEGADLGGLHSTAEAGVGRALQRSTERGEADPIGTASTGNASGGAQRTSADWDDDEDEWRHEPREPVDENPLKSFGKAVGDALTGSVDDGTPPKTPR